MILIIYAHPYPQHSHANKRMLEQAGTLEGVEIRSLYQLYPDFSGYPEKSLLAEPGSNPLSRPDGDLCYRLRIW